MFDVMYYEVTPTFLESFLHRREKERDRERVLGDIHQPREEWQLMKLCGKQLFLLSFSSPASQILLRAHHGLMWETLNSDRSCLGLAKPRRVTNCLAGCNCPSPSLTTMKPGWSTNGFFCHSL